MRLSAWIIALVCYSTVVFSLPLGQVKISGQVNTGPSVITDLLREAGNSGAEQLSNQLQKISRLPYFESVNYMVTENAGSNDVVVSVVEKMRISGIRIEHSNKKEQRYDSQVKNMLENREYVSQADIDAMTELIRNLNNEAGYPETTVLSTIQTTSGQTNKIQLLFVVKDGPLYRVDVIQTGLESPADEGWVLDQLKTKKAAFLLEHLANFSEKKWLQDRQGLLNALYSQGYLDARVNAWLWETNQIRLPEQIGILLKLDVDKGRKYKAGGFALSGNTLIPAKELLNRPPLMKGQVYNYQSVVKKLESISNRYLENGYCRAVFEIVTNRHESSDSVETTYRVVKEGVPSRVGGINLKGNFSSRDDMILSQLLIKNGDLYDYRKVHDSVKRLMRTGYFQTVEVNILAGQTDDAVILEFSVTEWRTAMITLGLVYSSDWGFGLMGGYYDHMLGGYDRRLSVNTELAQYVQNVSLFYHEPRLGGYNIYGQLRTGYQHRYYRNMVVDENQDGVIDGTGINYLLDRTRLLPYDFTSPYQFDYHSIYLNLKSGWEFMPFTQWYWKAGTDLKMYQQPNFTKPLYYSSSGWVNSGAFADKLAVGNVFLNYVETGLVYDTRDRLLGTTEGQYLSLSLNSSGGLLQGYSHFIRPSLNYSVYVGIPSLFTVSATLNSDWVLPQLGQTNAVYDPVILPECDGFSQLRGGLYLDLYGEVKNYASLEFLVPFYEMLNAFVFFDAVKMSPELEDFALNLDNSYFSFGIGLKVNMPMLPIQICLARTGYYSRDHQFRLTGSDDFFTEFQPVIMISGYWE